MKKFRYILLCLMVISLGLPTQLTAATEQDVAGIYNVTSQIKFKVKGLGNDVSTDSDLLILNTDGTFMLGDAEGTFSLDPKGKKILLVIDGKSLDDLELVFAEGIAELVKETEGINLDPGDITCEIQVVKISPIKIDKKTNLPKGKFKVNIKGIASAFIPGEGVKQRKVTFKGKFTIGEPVIDDDIIPVAGEWNGSAGFGDLSFTVDSTRTGITEITWYWTDFICDGIKLNGSRTLRYVTPEPIINGQFPAIEFDPFISPPDPSSTFSMSGIFDATGTQASGTYEAVVFGTTCPGTWSASPGGAATEIDWVGTPRVEHGALEKKFYQSFVVLGSSGNVSITATCKNSSGNTLDELTKGFPVEAGEEYEITVDATVLGLGRSPSPDSDDVFFSSSSASSSRESSIGDCTLTYDDVIGFWYYLCATDYSITDINIQLVP